MDALGGPWGSCRSSWHVVSFGEARSDSVWKHAPFPVLFVTQFPSPTHPTPTQHHKHNQIDEFTWAGWINMPVLVNCSPTGRKVTQSTCTLIRILISGTRNIPKVMSLPLYAKMSGESCDGRWWFSPTGAGDFANGRQVISNNGRG